MYPETKWGGALELMAEVAECFLGLPAEVAGGVATKIGGGTFDEGVDKVEKAMSEWSFKAADFGDEHAEELTQGAKKASCEIVFSAVTSALIGRAFGD